MSPEKPTRKPPRPKAPTGLQTAGRRLWDRLTEHYVFEPAEAAIVELAARQADDIALLEDAIASDGLVVRGSQGQRRLNAAVTEVRQGRLALGKLLGQLALPTEDDGRPMTEQSRRARQAANTRWARKRAVAEHRAALQAVDHSGPA